MSGFAVDRELGDDLCALVRASGVPLVEAVALHGSRYGGYRPSAFRLRFADGRVLKGRQLGNRQRVEAIALFSQHVVHPALPKLLAAAGRAVLTEWVDGRPLQAADCTPDVLQQCGAVHGFVHSRPAPTNTGHARRDAIDGWHARLEHHLQTLVHAGMLRRNEARHAHALALRQAAERCDIGFVHRDFCGENIVLRPSGEICIVDNETLGIDALEFDLGRTWYRWPMDETQRQAYLAGYERYRSAAAFTEYLTYWIIVALADAAMFRLTKAPDSAQVPVARLRSVLEQLEQTRAVDGAALGG